MSGNRCKMERPLPRLEGWAFYIIKRILSEGCAHFVIPDQAVKAAGKRLVALGLATSFSKKLSEKLYPSLALRRAQSRFPGSFPRRDSTAFYVACHDVCKDALRSIRDKKNRMLAKDRADVRGKTASSLLKRRTRSVTTVILGADDVKRKARLSDSKENPLRRRDRVAGKVPIGSRLNGRASLRGIDRSSKRGSSKRLPLPKPNQDSDGARGNGPFKRHVSRIAQEESARRGWERANHVTLWFVPNGMVEAQASHLAPDQAPRGWKEVNKAAGTYRRRFHRAYMHYELGVLQRAWRK